MRTREPTLSPPGRDALAGRREAALLDEPSVARMVDLLLARCRSPQPLVRAAVATLDRFRAHAGDLGAVLAAVRREPGTAEARLRRWLTGYPGLTDAQAAALGFGPKLWLRANGVPVPWRPLGGLPAWTRTAAVGSRPHPLDRAVRPLLLALAGSGLTAGELLGLRVGDAGSVDAAGELLPDLYAEPMAVSFQPEEGGPRRLAFLPFGARAAVHAGLAARPGAAEDAEAPLLGGTPAAALLERARRRHAQLIGAGNDVNVATCRTTGDFFRSWGLPGARFGVPTSEERHG